MTRFSSPLTLNKRNFAFSGKSRDIYFIHNESCQTKIPGGSNHGRGIVQTNELTIMTLRSAQNMQSNVRGRNAKVLFLIFVLLSSLWVSFPDCYKVEQPKAHSQVGTVSLGPEGQTGGHKVIRRLQPHHFSVTIFTAIRSNSTAALSEYPQQDCSSSG